MFSGKSFAFTSFLDLISCAFGSAILIFLVAVTNDSQAIKNPEADLVLVRCRSLGAAESSLEVQFLIRDPSGRTIKSAKELPLGFNKFIARAGEGAASFLLITKPLPGKWSIQAYWANGSLSRQMTSPVVLEVLCPRAKESEQIVRNLSFDAKTRFSQPVEFEVLEKKKPQQVE